MIDQPAMVEVDLQGDGVLWLINKQVFHPRGYALAVDNAGQLYLMGDGSEPWRYDLDEDTPFAAIAALLRRAGGVGSLAAVPLD